MPVPNIDAMPINAFPQLLRELIAMDRQEIPQSQVMTAALNFAGSLLLYKAEEGDDGAVVYVPFPTIPNLWVQGHDGPEGTPFRLMPDETLFKAWHHIPREGERLMLPASFMEWCEDVCMLMADFVHTDDVSTQDMAMWNMEIAGRTMRYMIPSREGLCNKDVIEHSFMPTGVMRFKQYIADKRIAFEHTERLLEDITHLMNERCWNTNIEGYKHTMDAVYGGMIDELKKRHAWKTHSELGGA